MHISGLGVFIIYVGGEGPIRGGGAKSFTPSQGGGGGHESFEGGQGGGGVMKVLRVVRGGGS